MRRDKESLAKLHPWPVVAASLYEPNSSDFVTAVIDATGLRVDWALTEREDHSHAMRIRAYKPRIQAAIEALPEQEQLVVASAVAREFREKADPGLVEKLLRRLKDIGWALSEDGLTSASLDLQEKFFPKGTPHDAYVEIRSILHQASQSVVVIDGYIGSDLLALIGSHSNKKLKTRILTYKVPIDFGAELKKFSHQYSGMTIEVRQSKHFHDRFLILDDARAYHLGASIKDAGSKGFFVSKIETLSVAKALLTDYATAWKQAVVFS